MSRWIQGAMRPGKILLVAAFIATCGCSARPRYDWETYEQSLQATYISHDEAKAWADLQASVTALQQQPEARVPPGLYAEYGFQLYKRGQAGPAIQCFEREASLFPESKPLMDRLVAKIQQKSEEPPATVQEGSR